MANIPNELRQYGYKFKCPEKSTSTYEEHDMDYCQDNNCKYYGNKEQCDRTNCYYRSYSTLFKEYKQKTQECEKWKLQATSLSYADTICALEIDLKHKIRECEEWQKEYRKLERDNDFLAGQNRKLRAENETYKAMLKYPEIRLALTDVRTGERELWQKYKSKMEKAEQKLEEIKKIADEDFLHTCWETYKNQLKRILQIIDGRQND